MSYFRSEESWKMLKQTHETIGNQFKTRVNEQYAGLNRVVLFLRHTTNHSKGHFLGHVVHALAVARHTCKLKQTARK
jgi:hypothetical protein